MATRCGKRHSKRNPVGDNEDVGQIALQCSVLETGSSIHTFPVTAFFFQNRKSAVRRFNFSFSLEACQDLSL